MYLMTGGHVYLMTGGHVYLMTGGHVLHQVSRCLSHHLVITCLYLSPDVQLAHLSANLRSRSITTGRAEDNHYKKPRCVMSCHQSCLHSLNI